MIDIETGSGSVYADLGNTDADEMLVKVQLATKIGEIIKSRRWSQQQAAVVLGMTQPKLSKEPLNKCRSQLQTDCSTQYFRRSAVLLR